MECSKNVLRGRIQAINDTKIQYLLVADSKIYIVKDIDFKNLMIEANETNLNVDDVEESELWNISYFDDFHIKLVNGGRMGDGVLV